MDVAAVMSPIWWVDLGFKVQQFCHSCYFKQLNWQQKLQTAIGYLLVNQSQSQSQIYLYSTFYVQNNSKCFKKNKKHCSREQKKH